MDVDDISRVTSRLESVRETTKDGLVEWPYRGRLVARQLDDVQVVIRAEFNYRDALLRQHPDTFSVPARFRKHMMIVADLTDGDLAAVEDAIEAAWVLQRSAD
jgi:hypothetical protein